MDLIPIRTIEDYINHFFVASLEYGMNQMCEETVCNSKFANCGLDVEFARILTPSEDL